MVSVPDSASPVARLDLKCTRCGAVGLQPEDAAWQCSHCGATFPIRAGVTRFVTDEAYSDSFGFEWNIFARTQLDSARGDSVSRDTFVMKTGWSPESLRGKVVLDAGCGMGRFAEVCANAGAVVYAVDLSRAVDAAARNLASRPDVHVLQADIMRLPFPEGSFDFIYSIGVLHHTPNTRAAFLGLPALLKPGGAIAIWVYSRRLKVFVGGEILRLLTPHLPKRWLLKASRVAIPLYYIHRLRKIGFVTSILLPTSMDPEPEWRWLDTFDWYSPRYQWKHTSEEVEAWFREAGLINVARGSFAVSARGTRPQS